MTIISGTPSDDTLTGAVSGDTYVGGLGDDIYIISAPSIRLVERLNEGTDTVRASVSYSLALNVENLELTGSDPIGGTGNSLNNRMTGNSANNVLNGGLGSDTLIGGLGNDTYIVDDPDDQIIESLDEGIDTVRSNVDWTLGDNLENLVLYGTGPINGTGNSLNNNITGNSGNNKLYGGEGNDILDGGLSGDDELYGGTGNDFYIIRSAGAQVFENANEGTDTVRSLINFTLPDNVENLALIENPSGAENGTGNSLDNNIKGNTKNNLLIGGDGNDTLNGGPGGVDTLDGGLGDDTYIIREAFDVISPDAGGIDTVVSDVNWTLASDLENLTLVGLNNVNGTGNDADNIIIGNGFNNSLDGGAGNDTLDGGSGNDNLNGGEGNDSLRGGQGNDTLDGGLGIDTFDGGLGNDIYIIDDAGDILLPDAGGIDTVQSSVSFTLADGLENLTLIGLNNINGTGNSANNIIIGNDFNNILNGGLGIDTFDGGLGNDTYIIDNSGDIILPDAGGLDTVESSVTYTLGNNLENLTLTGTAVINGTGNTLDNTITGNSAANSLNGGDGNDILTGGNGNDTLQGGAGNDTLDGGNGADSLSGGLGNDIYLINSTPNDTINEGLNEGTDTVESSVTYTLGNNLENLTLTGTAVINGTGNSLNNTITGNSAANSLNGSDGNDSLIGGNGNDTLQGGAGNDTLIGEVGNDSLIGGNGNDILIGGFGNDTLSGGLGSDTFVFNSLSEGIDVITDFQRRGNSSEGDVIQISQSGFGASSLNQFSYNNGDLFFEGVQFATIGNIPSFNVASDIVFV